MKKRLTQSQAFEHVLTRRITRREVLKYGGTAGAMMFLAPVNAALANTQSTLIGFDAIPTNTNDTVTLPKGYSSQILLSWGDSIKKPDQKFSNKATSADQASQFGDNTDGMELFYIGNPQTKNARMVMAINNEYYNPGFLFAHGLTAQSAEDVKKGQHAVGVTIVEVTQTNTNWQPLVNSPLNRRIHANSTFEITGPAAGSDYLKTKQDPTGRAAKGTFNNCGAGRTPWGTYLTCEENFNHFFGAPTGTTIDDSQARYGLATQDGGYNWWRHDSRFNMAEEPNEANRFGWVVEIDPSNPNSTPKKRTALGRFKHENAELTISKDGHVVVYMGDDESGEFLYRYVSNDTYDANHSANNETLLDNGVLYAARFNDDGTGQWLPLVFNQPGLTAKDGFKSQADILVRARLAATAVGATTMDRPEWVACHPSAPLVFCTLSNNSTRGDARGAPINAPNPRAYNHFGQIVRWWPKHLDHADAQFEWDLYAMAGNPKTQKELYAGSKNITPENMFNSPDGLKFDGFGRLWIQTDGNTSNLGIFAGQGNNQMLCGDPISGQIQRFMVGPVGCEITGIEFSNDHRSMFVGIQHPTGKWPNAEQDGVPRSSVIVITRDDGGIIGS